MSDQDHEDLTPETLVDLTRDYLTAVSASTSLALDDDEMMRVAMHVCEGLGRGVRDVVRHKHGDRVADDLMPPLDEEALALIRAIWEYVPGEARADLAQRYPVLQRI